MATNKALRNDITIFDTPIEKGIKQHFSIHELRAIGKGTLFEKDLTKKSLSYYENNFNLLSRSEKTYSFNLAFFQRITLPLEVTLASPVNCNDYQLDIFPNFAKFEELFEKYYSNFCVYVVENYELKANFKKKLNQIVFKLWLSGYGLLKGYSFRTINDEIIGYLFDRKAGLKKTAKFLAFILINEKLSEVSFIPDTKAKITKEESEDSKWDNLIKIHETEVASHFKDYFFEVIKKRVDGSCLLEYENANGAMVRESLAQITWGTFTAYSYGLQYLVSLLSNLGYDSVIDTFNAGIMDALSSEEYHELSQSKRSNIRIIAKMWVEHYAKTNKIHVNLSRIFPQSISNNESQFGKVINFGTAHTLISTLQEPLSIAFDEDVLFDYRCRRICLLQLATGQRLGEYLVLKKNCVKTDTNGTRWLHFQKTKNGREHFVKITDTELKWIEELKNVAPSVKISIPSAIYNFGDDELDYRLVANIYNDGALSISSVNRFLLNVQKHLWTNIDESTYFASHDLRRMHAVYMRISGNSKEDIQEKLNQIDIDSQLPYLQTLTPEVMDNFSEISSQGLWSHLTTSDEVNGEGVSIELEPIIKHSKRLESSQTDKDKTKDFIETMIQKTTQTTARFPNNSNKKLSPASYPFSANQCIANELMDCGHTELHCFSCDEYLPESDKLEEHKAETFRYVLLLAHNDELAKKNKLEGDLLKARSNEIQELLDKTFSTLFTKFNIDAGNAKKIEKEIYLTAKKYLYKYKKTKPTLTFKEVLSYLKEGVIDVCER